MKKTLVMSCMLAVQMVLSIGSTRAEDIDIFGQLPTSGVNPNVMILIDNASSNNADFAGNCTIPGWSTGKLMDAVTCALYTAIQQIGQQTSLQNRLNIGLIGPTAFGYTSQNLSVVLETQLPCKPCSKDGRDPCKNVVFQKCMIEITPEKVAHAAKLLLRPQ